MRSNTVLYLNAKAGLIKEISGQTYESLEKQIREVISNALDANADRVDITVKPNNIGSGKIIIADNGDGMSEEELVSEFLAVGGSSKKGQSNKIGRIGIGFLAITVLANKMELETRKKGTDLIIKARFDVGDFLDGDNHKMDLEELEFGRIISIKEANEEDDTHFTKIILTDVKPEQMERFTNPDYFKDLLNKLERVLPVKYHEDSVFFKSLTAPMKDKLMQQNEKTISIIFNAPVCGEGYLLVRRTYGQSPEEAISGSGYPINEVNIEGGSNDLKVFGYLLDGGKQLPSEWQGIVVRIKNVAVEMNTFFEYSKDTQATRRITGELFIEGLDEANAMTMNRSGFKKDHPDYVAVKSFMHTELIGFVRRVRDRAEINTDVKSKIKEIMAIRNSLNQINRTIIDNDIDLNKIINNESKLTDFESVDLKREIRNTNSAIQEVRPIATVSGDFEVNITADDFTEVLVTEEIISPEIYFGGDSFKYYLKKGKNTSPPMEIDTKKGELRINIGHPAMNSRNPDVIKIVSLLEIAYANAEGNADLLYDRLIDLLEKSYK